MFQILNVWMSLKFEGGCNKRKNVKKFFWPNFVFSAPKKFILFAQTFFLVLYDWWKYEVFILKRWHMCDTQYKRNCNTYYYEEMEKECQNWIIWKCVSTNQKSNLLGQEDCTRRIWYFYECTISCTKVYISTTQSLPQICYFSIQKVFFCL